jgi:hypothetical protein
LFNNNDDSDLHPPSGEGDYGEVSGLFHFRVLQPESVAFWHLRSCLKSSVGIHQSCHQLKPISTFI